MNIWLSREFASAEWGEGALVSHRADGAQIHLVSASPLQDVQQAARCLCNQGIYKVSLAGHWDREQQWAFAQGLQTPKREVELQWATCSEEDRAELEARWLCGRWVREMTNATPEQLGPLDLAVEAAAFITELAPDRVSHRILKGEALAQAGWVGLYQVGRGSDREPVMLELDFNPSKDPKAPVAAALVGKGITFDSGGYSMKTSQGMLTMKHDMGGAAIVTGALALAMLRGLNKRIKLILCCAENLVSGHAYKLGDILTYKNGTTVEIVNTDAEGRLVLADGLQLAGESGAPLIIDGATLTGAAVMALGGRYNALFGLDKGLVSRAMVYAESEQEAAWPLPLEPWHSQQCPSHYADTANSRPVPGGGPGGASNAAGFLSRFVANEGQGWLHIDLAACFNENGDGLWAPGANTLGMRTIARALQEETR
ncbi:aminopeptidase PepB [Aeromonas sp. BIGb0445]|uniref:aminopeptidase PepB n=1 Tax=Aeromonas sp. BIGb0445 TaxID=2940593 RepID=UPI00216A9EB2|nr:aminopeptidase PepB [Aeromonas sp. BIGb0445]MCS3460075.1 PepB aminopeptidase [Aeromonas sp. BIGb0445]